MQYIKCVECGGTGIQRTKKPRRFCSKKCQGKYLRKQDLERYRAYWRKYYYAKQEWHIQRSRKWQEKHPEWNRRLNNKATQRYKEKTRYGNNRQVLFEKYGGCEICGSTHRLQVHHIDRVSYHNSPKPNNRLENLRLLCQTCHLKLHHREGFRKKRKSDTPSNRR